jgi:hypothetical protein
MQHSADKLKTIQEEDNRVKLAIVAADNHYAGFGLFRNMLNLPLVNWEQKATKSSRTDITF